MNVDRSQMKNENVSSFFGEGTEILPSIREIRDLKELNALGCHYLLSANHCNYTRITTRSMRWLTVRNGNYFMTPEQENARRRIDELVIDNVNSIDRNLNLNILLDKDPRNLTGECFDDSYIKKLIVIGADVRFEDRDSKMKLVLQENELYVSFASGFAQTVNIGYHYIAKSKEDRLCRFLADEFDARFMKAQRLAVVNDKIVLADPTMTEKVRTAFKWSLREWASFILSVFASFLIGIIVTILCS